MPLTKPEAPENPKTLPAAPQNRQQKAIQWNVTYPKYKVEDLVLGPDTLSKLLEVVSYFENRELLFTAWGLAERSPQENGLAVKLYGPPGTRNTMAAHAIAG